ncbi:hypothetical protein GCM10009839_02030 [Catenulispora yoronensis]|uniref:Ricin B lectin domain-containing protein n=1 Tax=Catenulispora yoronensis TaxID=450799 RepID=A0ABP5F0X7_9ACTN
MTVALTLVGSVLGSVAPTAAEAAAGPVTNPASIVNPLLGTSNGGDTFPGADAPFGMVQWSPDTPKRPAGGNYDYSDSTITGFSLTHLSGPGCNATGDIPILPTVGGIDANATSGFSHGTESASAGSYAVTLGNGVKTELTATTRSGMARFTFPTTNQANLLFKLGSAATSTTVLNFGTVGTNEVAGAITSGHFCASSPTYTIYFDMVFDRSFSTNGTFANGGSVTFDASSNHVVQAKVGISYVSAANAVANRTAENSGWDFNGTRQNAQNAWNNVLGKIQIAGGTTDQQAVFYTSLYHSLLHPNVISDTNGQYTGWDHQVHTVGGGQGAQYANYSGWDIYRSQAQLEALVAPRQAGDSAQSMVNDYTQGGILPKWGLDNAETYVMNGDPAEAIIADYYAFGAHNFDTASAKAAMVKQSTVPNSIRSGLNYLTNYGYLPSDGTYASGFYGSVATLLEYDTADFAVSSFAGALGDSATQSQFLNRAQDWRNSFNPASGFMQPKLMNGSWTGGFDPSSSNNFVEGTSWQYTGMVPFNVRGLADAMGGNGPMGTYLDNVLSNFHGSNGTHADLGNEPSLELPWEYDYVGQPWKTQQIVRQVQDQLWPNNPANWSVGNDDLGTMSAWYVWSAMGLFPETPGTADLAIGSPLFTSVTVTLGGGGKISISAPQAADNAPFVQSATLNGSAWNNAYLPPSFATGGGTLAFTLGTSANTGWAAAGSSAPPSYAGTGGAQPPVTQPGATGPIASGLAGKCVDVANSGTGDGTAVQLYDCNGSSAQRWTVTGDGSVHALGKCLDASGSGIVNGTKLQLWSCNGSGAQQWRVDTATSALVNLNSGLCADDPAGTTTNGTQLQLYSCNSSVAQKWTPPVVHTGAITSAVAGKCVDDNTGSTADGNHIQLWSCNGSGAQSFAVPGDGTLMLAGRCVDVTGGGTTNGTKIELWDCNGGANQQWTYVAGTGALQNPQSGRCLDDPGATTTDGTQLELWDCNSTNAQHWTLPS